jgi:hypothetical protein
MLMHDWFTGDDFVSNGCYVLLFTNASLENDESRPLLYYFER